MQIRERNEELSKRRKEVKKETARSLGVVGLSLKMVKFEPTTCHNTVAKRTQHFAPNSVAI